MISSGELALEPPVSIRNCYRDVIFYCYRKQIINACQCLLTSAWFASSRSLHTASRVIYLQPQEMLPSSSFKSHTIGCFTLLSSSPPLSSFLFSLVCPSARALFDWFSNMTPIAGLLT
ncbi:uncharacterized protein EDB93DRAFT_1127164 [Suillus bovinus]|uniref:uncharacterized protein n=1 Tax=Suillus bovinus TaxID=48563 RepID=UPI001B865BA6|nr:uncharacterized protein EDB93DRAFT_1127164 [Suillus bovinus]KAG2156514.1 hypothetical protein EDB93DRAFT_1127164 [Suillus bovinus]